MKLLLFCCFSLCFVFAFYTFAIAATPTVSCSSTTKTITIDSAKPTTDIIDPLHPGEMVKFMVDVPASVTKVNWTVDGTAVTAQGNSLCYAFTQTGTKKVQVQEPETNQSQTVTVPVESYTNISIAKLLPNPVGSDTKEELVLKNGNEFTVNLQNWKLQSKTTSTNVPITVTIPANSEATVNSSNKLKNDGGTYDLMNESGITVDSITYGTLVEGQYVTKNGPVGGSATNGSSSSSVPPATDTHVTIAGMVTKPSGDTIDMKSDDGQNVHVVINASFDGTKPRLHQGDHIRVTGIWKKSSAGPYVSVRAGDTVTLLTPKSTTTAAKTTTKADSAGTTSQSNSTGDGLVVTSGTGMGADAPQPVLAEAGANTASSGFPPAHSPPRAADATQAVASVPLSQPLRWLFITMITLGTGLALPFHWGKSV